MKKAQELRLDNLEEVRALLNFLTELSHSKGINKVDLNTLLQLLESSRIDTLAKQAWLDNLHTT